MRAAIVGAGLMGRWHAHALARAGGSLVGVLDPDAEAVRRLAARHRGARPFAELDRLLTLTRPEVVHVCLPAPSHVEIGEAALLSGAHVLIEKPLAPDAPATERLLSLADSRGLLVCPVHQYLFQPGFLKALVWRERVGPFLHLEATACSEGGSGRSLTERDGRDGIVADILPHPLSVFERLLPGTVEAAVWNVGRTRPGELRASAAAAGVALSICISLGGRPTRNELRAIGARGTVHVDFFHGYGFLEPGAVSRHRKMLHPFSRAARRGGAAALNLGRRALAGEPAFPGLRALIESFYGAVRGKRPSPLPAAETLAVARARDRLLGASDEPFRELS